MSAASLARRMADAGASAELIAIAIEEMEALELSLSARRTADRERKRAQRERQKTAGVTGHSEDSHGTVTANVTDKGSLEVSPQTPLPKPSKSAPLSPPKFMEAWNVPAKRHGLPTIQSIAGERLKALRRRVSDHGEQAVMSAIAAVFRSPHWLGENGWMGNFDSMLRPANFVRLIEGTYSGKQEVQRVTDPQVLASNKRATAALYDRMGRSEEAADLRREAEQLEQRAAA
jgi:hypothetical protein